MQREQLKHLVCPDSKQSLTLSVDQELDGEVVTGTLSTADSSYPIREGIPSFVSGDVSEDQTVKSFAQKWGKHSYYRKHTAGFYLEWFLSRYGFGDTAGFSKFLSSCEFVLDAGTGSGRDATFFAEQGARTVFAVDTAFPALSNAKKDPECGRVNFVHADINRLPFPDGFFNFISCDQVIHHTPDPPATFRNLTGKLQSGGQVCCYVYKKKAVVREFTDDYVRERISHLDIDEALKVCEAITRLGKTLSDLKTTINVEEDIPVLGIRKGEIDIQRFFHWNVMKCFWNDDFDFFTNNIVNFDWYHPLYCFRYEPEEFRKWFNEGWHVEAWDVQDAGISCRAKKL